MKLYVTVGSGSFDQLIQQLDGIQFPAGWSLVGQIGRGRYQPAFEHFSFNRDYQKFLQRADLVICHAGAATVFQLLEMGKKLLVVPNLSRVDDHQQDLAQYLQTNNYAQVCWQLTDLKRDLNRCLDSNFRPYQKQAFHFASELRRYFDI